MPSPLESPRGRRKTAMSALPKLVHSRVAAAMSIALLLLVATVALAQAVEKAVSIAITSVPTYNPAGGEDKMETVSGTAGGCANCRVVIYVRTNKWWVQPFADSPFTPVKDGKWSTDTHLGHEYAALLVRPAFHFFVEETAPT